MTSLLQDLANLYDKYQAELEYDVAPFTLDGKEVDTDTSPILMGVVNLSRQSTYRESVAPSLTDAIRRGKIFSAQGAHLVDIGAESSRADARRISVPEQLETITPVIEALSRHGIPTSIESYEVEVISGALDAGAQMVNFSGTKNEQSVYEMIGSRGASLIMCFTPGQTVRDGIPVEVKPDPVPELINHFGPRLELASAFGVRSVAVDPGIGFDYGNGLDPIVKMRHQAQMLLHTFRLRRLGVPTCQILPHAFDLFQEEFRTAEGLFAVLADIGRVGIMRVHEVSRVAASLRFTSTVAVEPGDQE